MNKNKRYDFDLKERFTETVIHCAYVINTMVRTLYHVTKGEKAGQIWESGIRYEPPEANWVKDRGKMRSMIDKKGNEIYQNWIDRKKAVFFWTTHSKAMRYADKFLEPAIVEVDVNQECWCLPNRELEILYENFVSKSDKEKLNVERVVQMAREWNGERNDDIEVWTDSPVQSENIHQIYDINGDVFEID